MKKKVYGKAVEPDADDMAGFLPPRSGKAKPKAKPAKPVAGKFVNPFLPKKKK